MNTTDLLGRIDAKIAAHGKAKAFAVFDFDNTCIANDIAEATLNHMARCAMFRDPAIISGTSIGAAPNLAKAVFHRYYALLGEGDVLGAYRLNSMILSGFNDEEVSVLVDEVIAEEGEAICEAELFGTKIAKGLAARPQVVSLIEEFSRRGIENWVVSASPEPLVAGAMRRFGISGRLIAVKPKRNGMTYTADLESPLPIIGGKVDCIKLFIDPAARPLVGVGDSGNDLPMLEYSDIRVVVDRGNSLAEKARDEGWFLLSA